MKPLKIIILTIVLLLSFNNKTNAQFLKKLKSKVQQAAEDAVIDKAAQKAAQEAGKAMDSLLDIDPNYQAKNEEQLQNMLLQSGEDIPIDAIYSFDTNVIYKVEYENNKTPSTLDYSMWFSAKENYMAFEINNTSANTSKSKQKPADMLSIIDDKNQAMIIIMEEQKMAQIISTKTIKDLATEENKKDQIQNIDFTQLKKTGKSKKILGYSCEEYSRTTEDLKMIFWITQDVKLYQKNMFMNMSKSLGGNTFSNVPESVKGFMMEMYYENKLDNEKSSMVVTDIVKKTKTITTQDYQKMNLSGFMKN